MTYRNYLIRNNKTSSYFFRLKIPNDLREYFNQRTQFKISLRNGIKSESMLYSKILYSEVQSIFRSIRMSSVTKITVEQIQKILRDKVERTIVHSQHIVTDTNTFIGDEVEKKLEEINKEEDELESQIEKDYEKVLEHIDSEIQGVLKRKDLSIETKSLDFKKLRKQFLELRLMRNKWKRELLLDEWEEGQGTNVETIRKDIYQKYDIKDELSDKELNQKLQVSESILGSRVLNNEKENQIIKDDDSPKISVVREEFIRERLLSGFSPKSTREIDSTLGDLIEIIGDKSIGQVSMKDSRKFKNIISRLPKHRSQTKRYRDLTINQILKLDGVKGQETKNINKLIYRVRIFFKWLKNNYREYVSENYFEGITVDSRKVDRPRDCFTNDELKKIFDTTYFLNNTVRHERNKIKLPKYYVPLLCLFTGTRLDEMCQLRLEDVYKDGKYDVIKIRVSQNTKLKNIQSERIIPIHSTLKKLGFIEYCNYLRRMKKDRVFWELNKDRDGYGRNIGRFFGKYLKMMGIWEFQNKVFHSLRHTFITNLLQNGVREEVVNGLDGHKQKTMSTTVYFKGGFPSNVLYEEGISKLNFEGINFGKLKIDWKNYV